MLKDTIISMEQRLKNLMGQYKQQYNTGKDNKDLSSKIIKLKQDIRILKGDF